MGWVSKREIVVGGVPKSASRTNEQVTERDGQ